jgi:hypothetical protein
MPVFSMPEEFNDPRQHSAEVRARDLLICAM